MINITEKQIEEVLQTTTVGSSFEEFAQTINEIRVLLKVADDINDEYDKDPVMSMNYAHLDSILSSAVLMLGRCENYERYGEVK